MKRPRQIKRYCPHCEEHQEHDVSRVSDNPPSELKKGQRRFRRVTSGYRGFPRPQPSGDKPTKRVNLLYRCRECNKAHQSESERAKRFEFAD